MRCTIKRGVKFDKLQIWGYQAGGIILYARVPLRRIQDYTAASPILNLPSRDAFWGDDLGVVKFWIKIIVQPSDPKHGRIAITLPDLRGGGAERVSISLAREFVSRGFGVDFVVMRAIGDLLKDVPELARIINLQAPRTRNVPMVFAKYLRKEKPGAVIANMWPLTSYCILAHRFARSRARIVVSDHNSLSIQYKDWGIAHGAVLSTSLATTYRLADARVCVSAGVADDITRLSGIGCDRFTVIYNPISLPTDGDATGAEAAWQGWTGPRIITVGRLKKQKNHALLIRAFKRLSATTDARLMILGTGDLEEETKGAVRAAGLADKIFMPGAVADPAPYYRSADLFVLSSDYEGFGNVIVEALACGTPVVSTDCPSGPAEILENGRYGTLVPVGAERALADAMIAALDAEHDAEALKRRAADFAPEIAAEKYLQLLFPEDFIN